MDDDLQRMPACLQEKASKGPTRRACPSLRRCQRPQPPRPPLPSRSPLKEEEEEEDDEEDGDKEMGVEACFLTWSLTRAA